jgi:outer membrane protein assembly factor BamD
MVKKTLILGWCILLFGCGSSDIGRNISLEERFQHAKALFDDGDYLVAITEFTVITLQHPGSAYADDAQYYLGECRFQRQEYITAAYEYGVLTRNMPASPLVPDSRYKVGLSYYHLAPKSSLDQEYTRKAIDEFQAFLEYHATHENAEDAEAKIRELNTRLAKKQYDTARLYAIMERYKASLLSFDEVIEKFHDTEYAPLSYLGKTEVLIERKKFEEASSTLKLFFDRFPNSVLRGRAEKLREVVSQELQAKAGEVGRASAPDREYFTQHPKP